MVNVLKFRTLCSFCSQMLVIRAGIHKVLVKIANSRLLLLVHFDLGLHCLSRQATSVGNFRTAYLDLHCFYLRRSSTGSTPSICLSVRPGVPSLCNL